MVFPTVDGYQKAVEQKKDPRMTQKYAHLRDEAPKRASEVAGNIINRAAGNTKNKKVVDKESKGNLFSLAKEIKGS